MALTEILATAVAVLAGLYLLRELFIKVYATYSDSAKTVVAFPFLDRPPASRILEMHVVDTELVQKHGPVVRYINPLKPWDRAVVVAEPGLFKELFVGADWMKFQRRHDNLSPHDAYVRKLIAAENGPEWRATRALFDRTFTTVAVRKYTPILTDLRDIMIQQLEKANKENPDGFDAFPQFHRFTFDTITRLTFGAEVNAMTTKEGAELSHWFDRWLECGGLMANVKSLLGEWAFVLIPQILKDQKTAHEKLYGMLHEQKKRLESGKTTLSIMDDTWAQGKQEGMSEDHLENALMNVLFAGHDTTAALLGFLTYELSKRPDLQKEIRAEVEEANGPGPLVNLEVLEKCKVLNACIKESLRMRPSAPYGAMRTAFEDFTCNYTDANGVARSVNFQKGDQIFTALHAMQNYPAFWDRDTSKFIPERYYDDANGGGKLGLWVNSPFGNGARRCVGERLALGEGRLGIASILRKFDIEHVPETTWKFNEVFAGTIKPNKVMIKLKPIKA